MTTVFRTLFSLGLVSMLIVGCATHKEPSTAMTYDLLLRNGTIYDGNGGAPYVGNVAINDDTIVAVGTLSDARGRKEIDAAGLAVAPGFINMLSWATESLLHDGRSQGDIRQGVTLEVMGEGESMGPLTDQMRQDILTQQADLKYPIKWKTLGGYLDYLVKRGVSCNVASFVGATTVRIHEVGYADRVPTAVELDRMKQLVRQAMEEGAMGVASSLIYAPAFYAKTDELIALSKVAAEYDGLYISHLRSEGNQFLEALEEFLTIARDANIRAQVYHLKAAGSNNWHKLDAVIQRIESARAAGLRITADMYTYTAGATGLDAAMPPWVQEGGYTEWAKRLRDPAVRSRVLREMTTPSDACESLYLAAGSPERVVLVSFKNPKLKPLTGKTLAEVAKLRGKSPEETAIDL